MFGSTFVLRDRRGLRYRIEYGEPFSRLAGVPWWLREFTDDPGMLAYLERTLRPGDVVVDVGASIGVVALLAARLGCRVAAIEAERANYERLCANIALNQLHIASFHLAIADRRGLATLYVFPPGRRGHHSLAPDDAATAKQAVECTTIDDFLAREGIDRVDLLKIDVEGAEPEAFAGAAEALARAAIRRIVFEVSREPLVRMGHRVEDVVEPLRAAGYSIRSFGGEEIADAPEWRFANLVALAPGL
jgi:FkbM family methyltransferase